MASPVISSPGALRRWRLARCATQASARRSSRRQRYPRRDPSREASAARVSRNRDPARRNTGGGRYDGSAALLAQLVEHLHGKEGVSGSSPEEGLKKPLGFSDWACSLSASTTCTQDSNAATWRRSLCG